MANRIQQLGLEFVAKKFPGWKLDNKSGILTPDGIGRDDLKKHFFKKTVTDMPYAVGGLDNTEKLYKPDEKLEISGIANKNEVDRMDERLDPKGIIIEAYIRNPVLLYQHVHGWPIGLVTGLSPEEDGVKFTAWVGDPKAAPLTECQVECRSLIAQKILKAVSVGFIPLKMRMPAFNDQGLMIEPLLIEQWEMLELSVVAVPCNAGALFDAKAQGEDVSSTRKFWDFSLGNKGVNVNPKNQKEKEMEEELKKLNTIASSILAAVNSVKEGQDSIMKSVELLQAPGKGASDKPEDKPEDKPKDEPKKDVEELKATVEAHIKTSNEKIDALAGSLSKLAEAVTLIAEKQSK